MKPIDSLSDDEWLELVRRAISMPDAPPQLLRDALALWHLRLPRLAQPLHKRWVAVRSFDSWAGAPVSAGMRTLPSETRQMLFSAGDIEVDLRISPMAGGFALSGQVFGPGTQGDVELAALDGGDAGPARRSVTIDTSSEFRIDGVSRGTYLVTVRLTDDEIVLPPFDVGLSRDVNGP